MNTIVINNNKYTGASSWEEITYYEYCDIFFDLDENFDELEYVEWQNEAKVISRLLNCSQKEILNLNISDFNMLKETFKFLFKKHENWYIETQNQITINNVKYFIPEYSIMKVAQHIDIDIISNQKQTVKKWVELLASLLIPVGKEFDGEYEHLIEPIGDLPCTEVFPLLGFFLQKGENYKNLLLHYSKIKEMENHFANLM